jgi:hypothetical protein
MPEDHDVNPVNGVLQSLSTRFMCTIDSSLNRIHVCLRLHIPLSALNASNDHDSCPHPLIHPLTRHAHLSYIARNCSCRQCADQISHGRELSPRHNEEWSDTWTTIHQDRKRRRCKLRAQYAADESTYTCIRQLLGEAQKECRRVIHNQQLHPKHKRGGHHLPTLPSQSPQAR